jgi:hypothetical protein
MIRKARQPNRGCAQVECLSSILLNGANEVWQSVVCKKSALESEISLGNSCEKASREWCFISTKEVHISSLKREERGYQGQCLTS